MSWRRLGFFFTCGCVGSVLQAEVCYNIFIYTLTIHTGPSTSDSRPTFFYITSTTHWPIITRSARWRSPASWDVAAAPLSGPVNQCYAASHRRCCRSALRCHYFPSMPLTRGTVVRVAACAQAVYCSKRSCPVGFDPRTSHTAVKHVKVTCSMYVCYVAWCHQVACHSYLHAWTFAQKHRHIRRVVQTSVGLPTMSLW